MKRFSSIQSKILFRVIVMTVILIAVTITFNTISFNACIEKKTKGEIETAARDIIDEIETLKSLALEQSQSLSFRRELVEALKKNDREAMFKICSGFQSMRKADTFTICDAKGNVILRSRDKTKFGDPMLDIISVKDALEGKMTAHFSSTKGIPMSVRAAAPVYDENDKVIGVVASNFRLDTEDWVKHIKEHLGVENTTFVGKIRTMTTLVIPSGEKKGQLAIGTELTDPVVIKTVFEDKKDFYGKSVVLGTQMRVFYHPIIEENNTIGIIFAGLSIAQEGKDAKHNLYESLGIAGTVLILFIVILIFNIRSIVNPIRQITQAAADLDAGKLDIELNVKTNDETKILADAFLLLADSLKVKSKVAIEIANGNLTTWVPLSSPNDTLGIAFIQMRYAFYDSLKDLTSMVDSIRKEGTQLSQINERLVANSTETSSELVNITSVVDELNAATKANSDNSASAEKFAREATTGTVQGSEKMRRMVLSMNGITKSSQEIKNIIRVIDDIAFQTNLLALNAAVEAARAGTHGKGFAVVAEEVRNLAARSAKAAKETAALIEESIKQVDSGSKVAGETSEALSGIAARVGEIDGIITKIHNAATNQAVKLAETNDALRQVSETAQQNTQACSDAAEAVSQLTNTAQRLDSIVNHFHTNETGKVTKPEGDPGYLPNPEPVRIHNPEKE